MADLNLFEDRTYVVFDVTELDKIDFNTVMETSADTVRKSTDGTKTFVKWEGAVPQCVQDLTTKGEFLTYGQILELLQIPEWAGSEEGTGQ